MFIIFGCFLIVLCSASDSFRENLIISNLNDGISFHFDFQTTTSDLTSNNYHLFPKPISEIVKKYSLSEMHLTLSKGFWDTQKWGLSPISMPSESAELWAWFEPIETEIDKKWEHLSHALSGIFCTSLNKLSSKQEVISPKWAYSPEGLTIKARNNTFVRKSVLSGESVCTENLTPWIKLLPCKKLAGLAQLLKPSRMFSSHFTSITMSVKKICLTSDCTTIGRLIHQTITLVLDRRIFGNYLNTWSLVDLLDIDGKIDFCSLSEVSRIYVHGFGPLSLLDTAPSGSVDQGRIPFYDLIDFKMLNNKIQLKIGGAWSVAKNVNNLSKTCPIKFTKFATGTGNVRGGIKVIIESTSSKSIRAVYLDSFPWYFHFLFTSLTVKVNSNSTDRYQIHYVPSLIRERMTHLELVLDIPAYSTLTIEYEFRKLLQNWNEFPPDANHEFYIGASSLTFQFSGAPLGYNNSLFDVFGATGVKQSFMHPSSRVIRLHSEVVLVTMPSPDFSMPFNALCLACTVLAIMIGGVHKYTTCSVHVVDPKNEGVKAKLVLMVRFIQNKLRRKTIDDVTNETTVEKKNVKDPKRLEKMSDN